MTSRAPSLGRRLALGLAVAIVVSWCAAAGVAALVLKHEIDEVFDSALQEVAQRILPLAWSELLSREDGDRPQHLPPIGPHREAITYVVRGADGRELLQSSDADPARVPKDLTDGFTTVDGLRLYSEAAVKGSIRVTTVEPLAHRAETLRGAVFGLLMPLAALVPIALLAVHLLGRVMLRPVRAFGDRIGSRGRGNLDPLGAEGLPSEIAPIAGAVDALIERLRGALEAERSFTANSAHELRTPIAAALAQTQRLAAELDDDAARERARAIAASLRRLSGLSEKLLQLAKAEGGGLVAERPAPLGPVLRLVIDEIDRRRDIADRLVLDVAEGGGDAPCDLDPDAFAILARNLVENAVIHGSEEGRIVVRFDGRVLEVENDGPAVAPDVLARLGRRFERGATRGEGSGLGLAIVAAICRGVGAGFEMLSPVPGRGDGFLVRVRLATVVRS